MELGAGGCFRDDTTAEEGIKVVHTALKAGEISHRFSTISDSFWSTSD